MPIQFIKNTPVKSLSFLLLFLVFACGKKDKALPPAEEPVPVPTEGAVKVEFKNMVGDSALLFNRDYLSPRGDTFRVSKFNYFISNIELIAEDNSSFKEVESYHVIKHAGNLTSFTISKVPGGKYKAIRLMIGVDSLRNVSGAQTGALDPAGAGGDMFWSWNTGYIFLKLDGSSPRVNGPYKEISYHIGGYYGPNRAQRVCLLDFGTSRLNVSAGSTPQLTLKTDVNQVLKDPLTIDFMSLPSVTIPGPTARVMADNYSDMISVKSIVNP